MVQFPRAISSAGERCLHTAEVAGSIPASPTSFALPGSPEPALFANNFWCWSTGLTLFRAVAEDGHWGTFPGARPRRPWPTSRFRSSGADRWSREPGNSWLGGCAGGAAVPCDGQDVVKAVTAVTAVTATAIGAPAGIGQCILRINVARRSLLVEFRVAYRSKFFRGLVDLKFRDDQCEHERCRDGRTDPAYWVSVQLLAYGGQSSGSALPSPGRARRS